MYKVESWQTGRMQTDLVDALYDLGQQDVRVAADHRDEVKRVPRITEVILRNTAMTNNIWTD